MSKGREGTKERDTKRIPEEVRLLREDWAGKQIFCGVPTMEEESKEEEERQLPEKSNKLRVMG